MDDSTHDQFPSQPELSDKLPRFRLIRKLSETKMSVIYLAEETDLGNRPVAIKVIAPMLAEEDSFRERFRDEILRTANLGHHNIVPVYSAHTDGELLYLVMPYIDGPNLRDLLSSGPIDLAWVVHMIREMASALDFAHAAGIVHRDVKPSNILVQRQTGRVLLCDFGIAAPALGERLTEVGRQVGTPGYLAPELIPGNDGQHAPVDPRADVYSLGVVLYQCLTGRPPHQHSDVNALLWAQGHADPKPVTALRPELPRALDKVLATALARRPQDRYSTCMELADELTLAVSGGRVRGTKRPPPRPSPLRKVRWQPAAALVAAAAVIAAVVVVVVHSTDGTSAESPIFRVAPALRGDCDETALGLSGAEDTLMCRDGVQQVRYSLFPDRSTMDTAYDGILRDSGITRDTGDCTVVTGAEHRYPNGGGQVGRLLCYSEGGSTRLVWTDDRQRTVAEAESRAADDQALAKAWTGWVGIPAFPTDGEKSLIDLVDMERCERTEAGTLASFRDLVATVDCEPISVGVSSVTYYRFSTVDAMRRTYDQHVDAVNPPGLYCMDSPPNFLGNRSYDLRSVDLGSMLCYMDKPDRPVLEWTVEPLNVMVRATGSSPADLINWWRETGFGIPLEKVVTAANKAAKPEFPTAAESALLDRVPADTKKNCLRPSESWIEVHSATANTAGVVCGPSSGASIIFYYQFADANTMNAAYYGQQSASGGDCRQNPPDFSADAPYERGGDSGRLSCGTADNPARSPYLIWTSNKYNIMVLAFQAWNQQVLLTWWQNGGAGPA